MNREELRVVTEQLDTDKIADLALGQISSENALRLFYKELVISGLNDLVWDGAAGLFAYLLYHSVSLGVVMMRAMTLNLLVAAMGKLIMRKFFKT